MEEVVLRLEVVEVVNSNADLVTLIEIVELVKVSTVVLVCVVNTGMVVVRESVRVTVKRLVLTIVVTTVMTIGFRVEVLILLVSFEEDEDNVGLRLVVSVQEVVVLPKVGINKERARVVVVLMLEVKDVLGVMGSRVDVQLSNEAEDVLREMAVAEIVALNNSVQLPVIDLVGRTRLEVVASVQLSTRGEGGTVGT